ncbi:hypothetical protein G9A89_016746 [Geosiphon pyriformis]|nr:hypothetical protein G9A89_016746 [Geosiphon pyriformis]
MVFPTLRYQNNLFVDKGKMSISSIPLVELGFAEPSEYPLTADTFPSKIGGKPAWLNPRYILSAEEVTCGVCKSPMILLAQLYAPKDHPSQAYHRMIYVFCCKKGSCHKTSWQKSLKVFRSQLPKKNPYWPSLPSTPQKKESGEHVEKNSKADNDSELLVENLSGKKKEGKSNGNSSKSFETAKQCFVCGLLGSETCGKCQIPQYCSKDHQIEHWNTGNHKKYCNTPSSGDSSTIESDTQILCQKRVLFPEYEIISEPEINGDIDKDKVDKAFLKKKKDQSSVIGDQEYEESQETYEKSKVEVDRAFLKFQKKIQLDPYQVLRYARVESELKTEPEPLWVSENGKPSTIKDIQPCLHCGQPRTFEFQILSTLLNYLDIDHTQPNSLDWGTLLVYTCKQNCHVNKETNYVQEIIWRQVFTEEEPPTSGKVVLHTTAGDIDIELWAKEAPKAARNFIQLCLEGYYNGTIFHRVVPQFIIQGGDPTGTGQGGESIYGAPFSDEFHTRLRFVRRGLVAMANAGLNDNGSQFFITLGATEELQNKHTIFGKVVGDTIFNVLKIGELEVDVNERPFFPPSIISTEVLGNPFDDIFPRITAQEKLAQEASAIGGKKEEIKRKKVQKNVALLSFGEEASEFESASDSNLKIKSSHDLMEDNPRLSKELAVNLDALKEKQIAISDTDQLEKIKIHRSLEDEEESAEDFDRRMKVNVRLMVESIQNESLQKEKGPTLNKSEAIRQEIKQVTRDILKMNKAKDTDDEEGPAKKKTKVALNFIENERKKYLTSGRAVAARRKKGSEQDTLTQLRAFKTKLDAAPVEQPSKREVSKEAELCVLHSVPDCLSCRDTFGESQNDISDEGWFSHQLVFEKDYKGKDLMQRRDDPDDFIVIDPLARKQQAIEEEKEKRAQKAGRVSEIFTKSNRSHDYRERRKEYDHSEKDRGPGRYSSENKRRRDYDKEHQSSRRR